MHKPAQLIPAGQLGLCHNALENRVKRRPTKTRIPHFNRCKAEPRWLVCWSAPLLIQHNASECNAGFPVVGHGDEGSAKHLGRTRRADGAGWELQEQSRISRRREPPVRTGLRSDTGPMQDTGQELKEAVFSSEGGIQEKWAVPQDVQVLRRDGEDIEQ